MRPCTLHSQKTGTIGTMAERLGTIFCRGAGENTLFASMACGGLGTIGTIGTIFSTYARARGCGFKVSVLHQLCGTKQSVFTRRLETSSLSSLSSLKGCFLIADQYLGKTALAEKIVPEKGKIVPIVPKKNAGNQDAVALATVTTIY